MTWMDYVLRHADGDDLSTIGRRIGISGASVGRWRNSEPKPESVQLFAKAYGRPVLEAFVAAGFLTSDQAGESVTRSDPSDLSNKELVSELLARLERGEHRGNTAPNDQAVLPTFDIGTTADQNAPMPPSPAASLPNAAEARKAKADRKRASKDPMTPVERLAAGIPLDVPLAAQKRDPKAQKNNEGES